MLKQINGQTVEDDISYLYFLMSEFKFDFTFYKEILQQSNSDIDEAIRLLNQHELADAKAFLKRKQAVFQQ